MGVKAYSGRRLGCSVCPKTTTTNNSSSNKLRFEKKHVGKNVSTSQKYKCEKSEIIPIVNECYCYHTEPLKKEFCSKLICSKRFETPNIEIDEDWLNGILEFRRENWFDCHSSTAFFKNANPIYNIDVHTFNFNHSGNNVSVCVDINSLTKKAKLNKNLLIKK